MGSGEPTAHICGGGISGLALAVELSGRGWAVTVHERSPELRAVGGGITLWRNGLEALDALGALEAATADGEPLDGWSLRDGDGLPFRRGTAPTSSGLDTPGYAVRRSVLLSALADEAARRGAELITSSRAVGISPDGELKLVDDESVRADLVVAADGANSALRDLVVGSRAVSCGDGCSRHLVRRDASDGERVLNEYWSGSLRVGVIPLTPTATYVYACGPSKDRRARRLPLEVGYWSSAFPALSELFHRVESNSSIEWFDFRETRCDRWSTGRAAVLGDAAHAMSANLGQGGNRALENALALGRALDPTAVPASLKRWEAESRPPTEMAQKLSRWYGHAARASAPGLQRVRNRVVTGLMSLPPVERRMAIATGRASV